MKNLPPPRVKIIYLVLGAIIFGITLLAAPALAEWTEASCVQSGGWWYSDNCWANNPMINLEIPFGGLPASGRIGIAQYIGAIYKFGVTTASVLAIVMIIIGGFIWLTSAGSQTRITQAKGYIGGALIGLVLALGSYTILRLVNPALTEFRPLRVLYLEEEKVDSGANFCPASTEDMPLFDLNKKKQKVGDKGECGQDYKVGDAEATGTCPGSHCSGGGICLMDASKDPKTLPDGRKQAVMACQYPEDACNKVVDEKVGNLSLPTSQGACDQINNQIAWSVSNPTGTCHWVDEPYSDDACYWCPEDKEKVVADDLKSGKTKCEDLSVGRFTGTKEEDACNITVCSKSCSVYVGRPFWEGVTGTLASEARSLCK
ncbi:MAG: pilin [Patescibacteria group bacterium]